MIKFKTVMKRAAGHTAYGKEVLIRLRDLVKRVWYQLFYAARYPVDERMILFESYLGRQYACSPRALYEELGRSGQDKNFRIVWAFEAPERYQEPFRGSHVLLVKYNSREHMKYYSRAKYWITNYRVPVHVRKKKEQIYVQTWHGTPLKMIGCDTVNHMEIPAANRRTHGYYRRDGRQIDHLISPSPFYTEKVASAFAMDLHRTETARKVLELGYPRNDLLFTFTDEDVASVKKELHIPPDKKVILYAPTWRDDQHEAGVGYTYQMGLNMERLREGLSPDHVILFRAHYMICRLFDFEEYEGFLYDVSGYDDINRLYMVSDLLVTDYSSVFFDFANLKRPMLFYMYDHQIYKDKLRDLYFDVEQLPGPVVREVKDISGDIRELERTFVYDERYRAFNQKFNPHAGPCSGEVLNYVLVYAII
ncbi:MAG: CDP-glycerol glycerophosphotransferase family protein [Lachnospiraceae bacterium]|nr:CDP-glycerol glycerophosphotransferase family protein [Lachnospiraceae bacterium]